MPRWDRSATAGHPAGDPEKPHGDPLLDPGSSEQPGQVPESTNTEVGA
jgi:hypothetical protein